MDGPLCFLAAANKDDAVTKTALKRPMTMDDIARLANVSKPTVSRALRDSPLVNDDTKRRVLEIARANGYAVNRHARKLRSARTGTIAVVMDFRSFHGQRISDPFMYELLAGVSEALAVRNLDLLLVHAALPDAEAYGDLIASSSVDGFIVLGQGLRESVLREAASAGVPLVVWGAPMPDAPYVAIGSDNLHGGWLAGRHLLAMGRRRILFAGNIRHAEIALRLEGLRRAIAESAMKVEVRDALVDTFSYQASHEAALGVLAGDCLPDGVFAQSDTCAMAFVAAFRSAGRVAGRDFSIVGYNDLPTSAHFQPPLTTVRQDTLHAGKLLVDTLEEILGGGAPSSTLLETGLTIRES